MCASLYHLLLHTCICASDNGENRHNLLTGAFGVRLRSDFQDAYTAAGLTLSPVRWEVLRKPTVSIAVFSAGYFVGCYQVYAVFSSIAMDNVHKK